MIHPTGPENARIMIVGEYPVEQDILRSAPFIGGAGFELTKMLKEAGIFRESCFLTLVCRSRAPGGRTEGLVAEAKKYVTPAHIHHNGKWVLPQVMEGLELLKAEIERVKPNVVIAMGNLALWALTGEWGVSNWRSSVMESNLVPGQKVVPTLSPGMILVNWAQRPMLVHDLKRAKRQSAFPEVIRTEYSLVIRPNYEKAVQVLTLLLEAADDATGNRIAQGEAAAESGLCRDLLGLAGSSAQPGPVWVGQLQREGGLGPLRSLEAVERGYPSEDGTGPLVRDNSVHQSGSPADSDTAGKRDGQANDSQAVLLHHAGETEHDLDNAAQWGYLHRDRGYSERELLGLRESIQKNVIGGRPLRLGVDIETRAGHIACIAFAWSSTEAICIPLMCTGNPEGYWTADQEAYLVWLMHRILLQAHVIGQNWNYDATYIHHFWHTLAPLVTDTMIQQHSCFSNVEKSLAFLSSMYCDDHLYWKDDRTNWTEGPKGEGEDQYWIYNCTDAVRTFAINEVLDSVIKALDVVEVNKFQQHLRYLALKCMNRGILVHTENKRNFSFQMLNEVAERNAFIEQIVGHPLNIQSPPQMQQFFYGEMALTPIIDKKTKSNTTNDEALRLIAQREPILAPMCRKIAELRTLKVLHSTFIEAGTDRDGRIRTSFNVAGTDTYRFASKKNAFGGGCNFENVPKGGETEDGLDVPNIRKMFRPDPGHTIFDTDLDSADLRIVTWESDCQWMKEQFKNNRKPYVEVMKEYFHDQAKSKHSKEYPMFKALCHGTNYLGTAAGIAPRIGLLVHETERIQKWYYGMCPEIKKWQDEIKKQVEGRRFVRNAYGYKMHFFDRIQGTIFNQAVAWIPQSTVSCLINRIWNAIDRNLPEVEILNQVHDSLVGQFENHLGDWAKRRIIEESNLPIPYDDPLFIPMGIVTSQVSWGDCR